MEYELQKNLDSLLTSIETFDPAIHDPQSRDSQWYEMFLKARTFYTMANTNAIMNLDPTNIEGIVIDVLRKVHYVIPIDVNKGKEGNFHSQIRGWIIEARKIRSRIAHIESDEEDIEDDD